MTIIALDDEKLALDALLDAIREAAPEAQVHGFRSAEEALHFAREHSCDVAFLDVEMTEMDGMELAAQLVAQSPNVNIVFATGYDEYRVGAFAIHASGYLKKPITARKVRTELENLRRPVEEPPRLTARAFGNFEIYYNGVPLAFQYSRTKELIAYLIDRNSALCTNGEIIAALFEDDDNHDAYLRSLRKDLLDTLSAVGCADVIVQQRGRLGILPQKIACDYFRWLKGNRLGCEYHGEYMKQYSWAESTAALLDHSL